MIEIDTKKLNFFSQIHFCGSCRGLLSRNYEVRIGLRSQDEESFIATLVVSDETEGKIDFEEIEIELDELFCPSDLRVELSVALDDLNNPKAVFEAVLPEVCQIEFIYDKPDQFTVVVKSADQKAHCMTKQMTAKIDSAVARQFLEVG